MTRAWWLVALPLIAGCLEGTTGADVPPGASFKHWVEWSPFTYPFNVTQQPAASAPCGFTRDGLPIGLQIVGAMREDALVLQAARAFEQARPFATIDAPRA